jgi:hypothetical protein
MNLQSIANRISHADLSYVLGRFKIVRTTYSGARKLAAFGSPSTSHMADTPTLFRGRTFLKSFKLFVTKLYSSA